MIIRNSALAIIFCVFGVTLAFAQGAQVAFGGLKQDASLPVEIVADQLQISQADGSAMFSGNVEIGQGDMRITAGQVQVLYTAGDGDSTGQISRLIATGGVTVVNGSEAAEAARAEYSISGQSITMSGDVILTQGSNALSAERMVINLGNGTASMEGRVRTILQTGDNK